MFQNTHATMPMYLRFIERYASLGYAIVFSETGDFFESQTILERVFAEGYPIWAGRFSRNRDTEDTLRRLIRKQLPNGGGAHRAASTASFSMSRKIQEVQGAQGVLFGFPADEMVALFLEVVEEMPRDRAARLLGKTPEFFNEVHAELAKSIEKWRPADPEALEVFSRTLRQYRLPPSFLNNIEGKMDYSWRRSFNAPSLLRNALIAVGVVVVVIFASRDRGVGVLNRYASRPVSYDQYVNYQAQAPALRLDGDLLSVGSGNLLLWLDLILLASILALKRGLERHEGEGLALSGEFEHPLTSLAVLHTFGVILVTAGVAHFVKPAIFLDSWVPTVYVAAHAIFLPLSAAGIMRVLLRVMLHREGRTAA
jgi:hypothetical protein